VQILCADCGCLQKNVKVANRPTSVPIVSWNNVAVGMGIVNETTFSSTSLDNVYVRKIITFHNMS
jgi:hypothetical protein